MALEGCWILSNLLYGPDWIAENILIQNGEPSFIYQLIEQFLKTDDSQLVEQSLYVINNCIQSRPDSKVSALYTTQSCVLQAIYTLFDKELVHKSLLSIGGAVLTLLARHRNNKKPENDDLFVFCAKVLLNCKYPEQNLSGC